MFHVCLISVLMISVLVSISYSFSKSAALSVSEIFARFPFTTTINFSLPTVYLRLRLFFRLALRLVSFRFPGPSEVTELPPSSPVAF
jgi:hypothetical protein